MPLPAGGKTLWPPPELDPVARKLTEWDAWYSGDTDALTSFYSGAGSLTHPTARAFFSSDKPRGEGPTTAPRVFWGERIPPGTLRTKLHVPVASDIAELSANLLFGEMPTFVATDRSTQKELDAFQTDGAHAALRQAAEICAALGGVFLKVVWDQGEADRPWLVPVSPENAVCSWAWDRLRGVTFWDIRYQDDRDTLRLLELHERGSISYGLYKGTPTELGERIPLSAYEGTADLAELYGDDGVLLTNIPWMTATYVPNVRPNRVWRHVRCAQNLGRPDVSGSEGLMDALDESATSWMRDIRTGTAKIMVPASMLETDGPGQGARFDAQREVFIGLEGMLGNADSGNIVRDQGLIRANEHQITVEKLYAQIIQTAGYSAQSFGGNGDVAAMTATEVEARKEQSLTTRAQKILYWRPALQDVFQALLGIDREVFGHGSAPEAGIDVMFPQAVQPSLRELAEALKVAVEAKAMSLKLRVQTLHPTWTKTQVDQEVAAILAEEAPAPAARPVVEPAPLPQ
ncbi:phage portal protein [Streptomyces sp. RK23]|uniref:phage portal protein n=1 Tax=unclassified Streptomyces TaxID=2593676 RepID=UPI001B390789|nr:MULTISPECIES: phage portal protein [unclassified Streptomyces]MBQ0969212.1 phage portal protein [Streptomyces sp. RK74B]MBQ1004793.1 phage portal protein [Streptomyces sp. RK23]